MPTSQGAGLVLNFAAAQVFGAGMEVSDRGPENA